MLNWELKKIIKGKTIIGTTLTFLVLCIIMSLINPKLETQHEYFENDHYVTDQRDAKSIADEKLQAKVKVLKDLEAEKEDAKAPEMLKKLGDMAEQKLQKDPGKEYEEIAFYKVFNARVNNMGVGLLLIGIIIAIFSNSYIDEKLSHVDTIILSSKNRNKVLYTKLFIAIIVPIIVYASYIGIIGVVTSMQYGLPVHGELQAYRIIDTVQFLKGAFSINQYTLMNITTLLLILITLSIFSSLFSFITNSSVAAIVGVTVFFVFAKILAAVKFIPAILSTIFGLVNYIDILQQPQLLTTSYLGNIEIMGAAINLINLVYAILIMIPIIGLIAHIFVFKKILDK